MALGERILKEVREIGLVTLYFLACALLFLALKKLLLAEYQIEVSILRVAVIGAAVTAKVVILLGKTSVGLRFAKHVPALHVLWRSLVYTGAVVLVTLLEHLYELYRQDGHLPAALDDLWSGKDFHHFLALNLCVGVSLLAYNTFAELERRLGEGGLRKFFFTR